MTENKRRREDEKENGEKLKTDERQPAGGEEGEKSKSKGSKRLFGRTSTQTNPQRVKLRRISTTDELSCFKMNLEITAIEATMFSLWKLQLNFLLSSLLSLSCLA